jgi:hypothetical protein
LFTVAVIHIRIAHEPAAYRFITDRNDKKYIIPYGRNAIPYKKS